MDVEETKKRQERQKNEPSIVWEWLTILAVILTFTTIGLKLLQIIHPVWFVTLPR